MLAVLINIRYLNEIQTDLPYFFLSVLSVCAKLPCKPLYFQMVILKQPNINNGVNITKILFRKCSQSSLYLFIQYRHEQCLSIDFIQGRKVFLEKKKKPLTMHLHSL